MTNVKSSPRANPGLIGAVVAIVLTALIIAFMTAGGETAPVVSPYGTDIAIAGSSLPPLASGPDEAVGKSAPIVVTTTADGTSVELGDGGRPQILAFLAHWCSHCQAEVPVVVPWLEAGGLSADVDMYAVATATDSGQPNFPPQTWLDREGWPEPVVLDSETSEIAGAYGVSSFPFWVVLDSDGLVVARVTGELPVEQLDLLVALATGTGG